MYGLTFVVAAIFAAQASAEAQDNAYYMVQPEIAPLPAYQAQAYGAQVYGAPHYGGYGAAYDPAVQYVQVAPVAPVPHVAPVIAEPAVVRHDTAYIAEPTVVRHDTGYVEVPEQLYDRYMSGYLPSVPYHEAHHEVTTTHHQVDPLHGMITREEKSYTSPDYEIHYSPGYFAHH